MPQLRDSHKGFSGLDLRKLTEASDPRSFRVAVNVDLTIAGGIRARDVLVPFAVVDSKSVGLYALGGQLRCVVPGGDGSIVPPPGVVYDRIGDGGSSYGTSIDSLSAYESMGTNSGGTVKPYLVIKRTTGVYEHHWIQTPPYPISNTVNTKVYLPFKPGAHMIKAVEKLWAVDIYDNGVRYSSVTNGPTDWTFPNDAGELPVQGHARGDATVQGMGLIEGQLAVYLSDSVQLWKIFADPSNANFGLNRILDGPGTLAPRSIANALGDLFYFSRGGFRSLKQNALTGQFREGDLGANIQPLTRYIDPTISGQRPVGIWSQARQQYLCAVGTTVYALTYTKELDKIMSGWTLWQLPAAAEYMVELNGDLYIRAGTTVYKAVRGADVSLEPGYNWTVKSQFFDQGDPHVNKEYDFLEMVQQGGSNVSLYDDIRNPDVAVGDPLVTNHDDLGYVPLGMLAYRLSVGFTGADNAWQLEQYDLYYQRAGA